MKDGIARLLLGVALLVTWISCSNEIQVSIPEEVYDVTFTASIGVNGIDTKGGEPSAQEKKVKDIVVFVFRNVESSDTLISRTFVDNLGEQSSVKVSIKAKSGDVRIVALANISEIKPALTTSKPVSYKKFEEEVLSVDAFKSDYLPKYAVKNASLEVAIEDGAEVKPNIDMILQQSAARVDIDTDFTITNNAGGKYSFEVSEIKVEGDNLSSNVILNNYNEGLDAYPSNTFSTKNGLVLNAETGYSFYTFEKDTRNGKDIVLTFKGNLIKNGNPLSKVYKMSLNPIWGQGVNSKTNGFIHGYVYTVSGTITPENDEIIATVKVVPMDKYPLDVDYGKDEDWGKK